jgi:hypothetical protein
MSHDDQRTEQLLTFFTERGYQPILLARSDLLPPEVYFFGDNWYHRHGPLRNLLAGANSLPEPSVGELPELERIRTDSKKAHLSFSFFDQLLKKFGLAGAKGNAKADAAGDEVLRFQGVTIRSVSPNEIETALNEGFHVEKLGKDRIEQGIVHIAYEYIYSNKVQVIIGNRSNVSVGLSANLPHAAEVKADVSTQGKDADATTYQKKDRPVAIALKCAKLEREGRVWRLRLTRSSGVGIGPRGTVRTPYIFRPNAVLTIEE